MSKRTENRPAPAGLWNPARPFRPDRFPVFYGWVIVAVSTLGTLASMPGQTIGVGVFNPRLMEAMGLSAIQLSSAYMVGTLLSATMLGKGGVFFDRVGARKALVLSVVSMGLVLFALTGTDAAAGLLGRLPYFAGAPWLPGFLVLCLGFACLRFTGQGMVTLSARAMLGKWFERRRGLVTAIQGVLVSFGFSSSPLLFEYLIRGHGWKGAWQILGVVAVFILPVFFWLFARDNPEECGLEMDGGIAPPGGQVNPDNVVHRDYNRREASRTYAFWAFALVFALQALVSTAYAFHVKAIGEELGVSDDYILGLFLPTAGMSVVSSLLIGWVADMTRIKYLLALMAFAAGAGFGTVALGSYPAAGWLHAAGFGLAGGCFGSLSALVWPRFFGREHLGAISGLFMMVIVVSSAVGPILFSLSDRFLGGYRLAFGLSALVAGALFIGSFRADNPQRRASGGGEAG